MTSVVDIWTIWASIRSPPLLNCVDTYALQHTEFEYIVLLQYYWIAHSILWPHYWTSQKQIFKCLSLHLKKVVFADSSWFMYGHGFQSCWVNQKPESNFFELVQFLLKNVKVLQKIIINTSSLEDVMPKEISQAHKRIFELFKILSWGNSSAFLVIDTLSHFNMC